MFEKRDRFRDVGRPGAAWIFTIAARQLAHYCRHQLVEDKAIQRLGWTIPTLDQESAAAIERICGSGVPADLLEHALQRLPVRERDAVELKVLQELAYREIGERLNCSVVAARVRVHRGLARMNKTIESSNDRA